METTEEHKVLRPIKRAKKCVKQSRKKVHRTGKIGPSESRDVEWFCVVFGEMIRCGSQACLAVHGEFHALLLISGPKWMCSASICHMHQWEQHPSANGTFFASARLQTRSGSVHFPGPVFRQPLPVLTKTIRRGHFCSRLSNVPTTDCSSTCGPTRCRLHAVYRACEEAGPDRGSGREESSGGAELPTRRVRCSRATFGRPPGRCFKGEVTGDVPP